MVNSVSTKMFRDALPVNYVTVFLAMVIYTSLPGAVAFVAFSVTTFTHVESVGSRFYSIERSSLQLSSKHRSNQEAESMLTNGCCGLDHRQDPSTTNRPPQNQEANQETDSLASSRRNALLRVGSIAFVATLMPVVTPFPVLALKQKNEALCGTGFFEHIYEYKCTAIGDIQDEGMSKTMSQAETGVTDSLMGKLGFDTETL